MPVSSEKQPASWWTGQKRSFMLVSLLWICGVIFFLLLLGTVVGIISFMLWTLWLPTQ
jgi:hypothetical protein